MEGFVKVSFFCLFFFAFGCSYTSRNAIAGYVKIIDRMQPGTKREETFLKTTSFYSPRICERFFLVPPLSKTFYTNLGADLVISGEDRYETYYTYTKTVKRDNKATKDEMTPLVFLNSKLLGKGWNFYDSLFVKH